MGKKGSWFSAVKKALSPESNGKKEKKTRKSKRWFGRQRSVDLDSSYTETAIATPTAPSSLEGIKLTEAENEQNEHAYSVALATAVAAEAAAAAAKAAADVVWLTAAARYSGKSKEEIAAIKIQAAFRGYMARRALRALRGLVRLKTMVQGQSVKRQATTTLRCMQTLARVQSQIRERRIRMSEENEALQRQIQQKHEKELEKKLRTSIGENWNDSAQSKEQHEASLQSKQEAAIRRERALAYAYSHQQTRRNSSKSENQTFMDPNNPYWGWSWLERWMASRPWESKIAVEKELNSDRASVKSTATRAASVGEFHSYYEDNKRSPPARGQTHPSSRQSPSTPHSRTPTSSHIAGKLRSPSVKGSNRCTDEDLRSLCSAQSEFQRRHSIGGSSVRDDESLTSSPAVPSYMAPTHSAKAKSRLQSPLGLEKNGTPDKGSVSSTKKRLSFSTPPATRRHSGPPKMDTSPLKGISATS